MMTGLQMFADGIHLFGMLCLLFGIFKVKSGESVSLVSQYLYFSTYTLRYLDIFSRPLTSYYSFYLLSMKLLYFSITAAIIIYLHGFKRATIQQETKWWFVTLPAALFLSFFIAYNNGFMELMWCSSIIMECVALLPQILMIYTGRGCMKHVLLYIVLVGAYRFFYAANWVYKVHYQAGYSDPISWIFGSLQCAAILCTLIFLKVGAGTRVYWILTEEGDLELNQYVTLDDDVEEVLNRIPDSRKQPDADKSLNELTI